MTKLDRLNGRAAELLECLKIILGYVRNGEDDFDTDAWIDRAELAIIRATRDCDEIFASKPLPESQGPEMTQAQVQAFKAIWQPFVDVLKGKAP